MLADSPNKAFQKLKTIFEGTDNFERAASAIAHLRDVIDYTKRFEVRSRIYVNPLGSLKEKFCKGGVIFSCLYDRKVRDVFAAGGRYDSLIREHRHRTGSHADERHAVGFNLAWEKLARLPKASAKGFLKKADEELQGIWTTKRVCSDFIFIIAYLIICIPGSSTNCLLSAMYWLLAMILPFYELPASISFSNSGQTT